MCMTVYLATDRRIPEPPDDEIWQHLRRGPLDPNRPHPIAAVFTRRQVQWVSPADRCGCEFSFDDAPPDDPRWGPRQALVAYLDWALRFVDEVELYACWEGDDGQPPLTRDTVRSAELILWRTRFVERELLTVERDT